MKFEVGCRYFCGEVVDVGVVGEGGLGEGVVDIDVVGECFFDVG